MPANFLTRAGFQYPTDNHPQRTVHMHGKGLVSFTPQEIWLVGGIKNLPVAAAQIDVVSTNVNDDAAGTNARSVRIYGLDANYNELSEVVALVGNATVQTVGSYLRVFGAHLVDTGVNPFNDGSIDFNHPVAGIQTRIFALVFALGTNTTLGTHYTIPAGKVGYLTKWNVTRPNFANQQETYLQWREFDPTLNNPAYVSYDNEGSVASSGERVFQTPLLIPEKADIRVIAWSTAGTQPHCSYEIVLVDKPDPVVAVSFP